MKRRRKRHNGLAPREVRRSLAASMIGADRADIVDWVVDYAESKHRPEMRFSDIPQAVFDSLEMDEEIPLFPDDKTGRVILMLYVFSDESVKRGGTCQIRDGEMEKVYEIFSVGLSVEKLRRLGLVEYEVKGGDVFAGFEYEMTLAPFFRRVSEELGITEQEAFDLVKKNDIDTLNELTGRKSSGAVN
jgi:hypothetical protein